MNKLLLMVPPNLSRILFGIWLIGMALSDPQSWVRINFSGLNVILGLILVAAGIFTLLKR